MSTSSKKKTQKKNDTIGNDDNNVAKVNTTSYANAVAGAGFGKPAKRMQTMKPMKKKKKKPTIFGMTSEDIKKKTKKNYGGA